MKVFENRVLRIAFGPNSNVATGDLRYLQIDKLND
jgi:hypothetical protein